MECRLLLAQEEIDLLAFVAQNRKQNVGHDAGDVRAAAPAPNWQNLHLLQVVAHSLALDNAQLGDKTQDDGLDGSGQLLRSTRLGRGRGRPLYRSTPYRAGRRALHDFTIRRHLAGSWPLACGAQLGVSWHQVGVSKCGGLKLKVG